MRSKGRSNRPVNGASSGAYRYAATILSILTVAELLFVEPYAGGPAIAQYDHIIDWFKKRHDTLIDDFEPLQAGSRRVMEFDGSDWRDITSRIVRETRSRIEEMEFLVRIYQLRNEHPPNLDSSSSEQEKASSSERKEASSNEQKKVS